MAEVFQDCSASEDENNKIKLSPTDTVVTLKIYRIFIANSKEIDIIKDAKFMRSITLYKY